MNPPDREQLKALAHAIEAARARGDIGEADRLVGLFNDLISTAPSVPQEAVVPIPSPQPEAIPPEPSLQSVDATPPKSLLEDVLAQQSRNQVDTSVYDVDTLLDAYPESVRPLVQSFIDEVSREVQVPGAVLLPMFDEEFKILISQKLAEESLLERLSEEERQRSVLLRYHDELLDVLKKRNT